MIKKILFLFLILISFNNSYSLTNTSCEFVFLNNDNFNILLLNNSFDSAITEITDRIIANNFTIDEQYNLFDNENSIDITIKFQANLINNNLLGIFIPSQNFIIIYVGNIYNRETNNLTKYNNTILNMKATIKHELIHYIDSRDEFINVSQSINLNLSTTNEVLNLPYFISLYNNPFDNLVIAPVLKHNINYQNVFLNSSSYTISKYRNEIVARTYSLCFTETNNSIFSVATYPYCSNFNITNQDLISINKINKIFLRDYLKTQFPSFTTKAKNINDNCVLSRNSQFFPQIGRDISSFFLGFNQQLVNILLILGIIGGIGILFSSLIQYLNIKLK